MRGGYTLFAAPADEITVLEVGLQALGRQIGLRSRRGAAGAFGPRGASAALRKGSSARTGTIAKSPGREPKRAGSGMYFITRFHPRFENVGEKKNFSVPIVWTLSLGGPGRY